MNVNWKIVAVGVAATVLGFLLESAGPIGSRIWPMASGLPQPEGANLALLMLMGGIEALAFGLGVAFLVFGYAWVRRLGLSPAHTTAAYLSTAWLLVNWVPHTALHMAHGNITKPEHFAGLVGIEYGFHLTLIISGAVVLWTIARIGRPAAATTTSATKGTTTPR